MKNSRKRHTLKVGTAAINTHTSRTFDKLAHLPAHDMQIDRDKFLYENIFFLLRVVETNWQPSGFHNS